MAHTTTFHCNALRTDTSEIFEDQTEGPRACGQTHSYGAEVSLSSHRLRFKCPLCNTEMTTEDSDNIGWITWVCPVDDYTVDQVT